MMCETILYHVYMTGFAKRGLIRTPLPTLRFYHHSIDTLSNNLYVCACIVAHSLPV